MPKSLKFLGDVFTQTWLIESALFILIICALWLPRGFELARFVTPDEPRWLMRSANFYEALTQGDFEHTYQKEHPGVTIMWVGTAGFIRRFPQYVELNPGQKYQLQRFSRFLENRNYEPMQILKAGRIFMVLGIIVILALAFLATRRLLGLIPAVVGFFFIAFDPFSIALSRLLHLDGLLSVLMLLSILSYMNFLYRGHRIIDLTISAIAAGLSWLTKSPSLFLIPFLGLLTMIEFGRLWMARKRLNVKDLWRVSWPILAWIGIAAIIFVLFWPAMWVNPVESVWMILSESSNYASEGHHAATFFNNQIFEDGTSVWYFYPVNYLWRTTPPVLIGIGLAIIAIIFRNRFSLPRDEWCVTLILILFSVLFTVFMTIGAKKFDRYLLPVFAPLQLVAAIGWVIVLRKTIPKIISHRRPVLSHGRIAQYIIAVSLVMVILIQMIGALQTFPYYFSYYNPLMGGSRKAPEVMMIGWGEGLDQAARYLNTKPNAQELTVQSWYPEGSFSYIFTGHTLVKEFEPDPASLMKADYYVVYYHQWQRQRPSEEFIQYFSEKIPEYIIRIDGIDYANIYNLQNIQ